MKNKTLAGKILRILSVVVVFWGLLLLAAFISMPKEKEKAKKKESSASSAAEAVDMEKGAGMADAANEGMAAEEQEAQDVEVPDMTMPNMPSGDITVPDVSLPDVSDQDKSQDKDSQADGSYGYGISDAIAFSADATNEGPFNWGHDYWRNTSYVLHFDGTLEITDEYSLSGKTFTTKKMNRQDFDTIMSLISVVMEEKPFDDIDYSQACDGTTWGFAIYAPTGAKTYIYGGYTYGCTDLESIQSILKSYEDKISLSDRAYLLLEGEYVCSNDDRKVIRIYTYKNTKFIELDKKTYTLTDIELEEEQVLFQYEENGKVTTVQFIYSPDMMILKHADEDIPYVRK